MLTVPCRNHKENRTRVHYDFSFSLSTLSVNFFHLVIAVWAKQLHSLTCDEQKVKENIST